MDGVSVDHLVRLEQDRASNPSPQVLAALARAPRLIDTGRDLLLVLAATATARGRWQALFDAGDHHVAVTVVSDLHDAAGRYPHDREPAAMIVGLRAASDRSTQLWDASTVTR